MYAVISSGGKQYRVQKGDVIYVEKLELDEGASLNFDVLMLAKDGEGAKVGTPIVNGAAVEGIVRGQVKGSKVMIFKYKAKKNSRKKQGHRQPYTKVEITAING